MIGQRETTMAICTDEPQPMASSGPCTHKSFSQDQHRLGVTSDQVACGTNLPR